MQRTKVESKKKHFEQSAGHVGQALRAAEGRAQSRALVRSACTSAQSRTLVRSGCTNLLSDNFYFHYIAPWLFHYVAPWLSTTSQTSFNRWANPWANPGQTPGKPLSFLGKPLDAGVLACMTYCTKPHTAILQIRPSDSFIIIQT